ncbi:MAG TPA: MerR family transcriptional regulator [Acidimicrobiia bacterium]|nr:MerR family transcriptional regulator [Acidimicrobiia bacterium]
MSEEGLTIGALARLAGVTVRTLHHYHRIGLVVPEERTGGGYRLYGRSQVERLQEVLFFRELGFGLEEIRRIVDEPSYDRAAALARQRTLLVERAGHLQDLIEAVDGALDAEKRGTRMTNEEMLEVFGDFDPSQYEEEARQRWGDTEAYRESARRTSRYTKADWQQIGREGAEINAAFLALMKAGTPAADPAATAVAERHRAYISKWFYECSPEIHAGLGAMYVTDPRFTASIDRAGPGLARYMSEAIAANAGRRT